jgi:hypothetical protein
MGPPVGVQIRKSYSWRYLCQRQGLATAPVRIRVNLRRSRRSSKDFTPEASIRHRSLPAEVGVLESIMSLAYRIVFECPKGHSINLQKKCSNMSLSETEAMKLFGDEELSCPHANCGWRGKASDAKLRRILRFNWILAPAT